MQHFRNLAEIAVFATLATAGLASSASAQTTGNPWDDVRSQRVSYRDLNINEEAGARILLARVRRAASNVCGPNEFDGLTDGRRQYTNCVASATTRAITELNNPLVSAMANPEHDKGRTSLAAVAP